FRDFGQFVYLTPGVGIIRILITFLIEYQFGKGIFEDLCCGVAGNKNDFSFHLNLIGGFIEEAFSWPKYGRNSGFTSAYVGIRVLVISLAEVDLAIQVVIKAVRVLIAREGVVRLQGSSL